MTTGPQDGPLEEEAPLPGPPPGGAADQPDEADAERAAAESEPAGVTDPGDRAGATPALEQELAERTADLQRIQAEFLNYKRRVDRDRELVRQNAVFAVLSPMLDVLDSIDRAREHGELEGGFKGVADQLERIVSGLGLTRYAEPGDAFDPLLHEALSHIGTDPGVSVVTCKQVVKSGYRIGDRVVRAAQVLVVDPAEMTEPAEPAESSDDE
ncbi:nucleotide exchange factor GrpE [Nocardioides terrisoli]|uniref:nucleotide exchange factor GrpE n=1 Tax=Nocardioides terrisoli TaxID=3388267 RepID=UPI00287B9A72|nr:nucleotide exchange factor GrpE [Nocardioides marmorisolisilvae]